MRSLQQNKLRNFKRNDFLVIMSVDYGDVRTGIAVCDKFEMLASPVCSITQRNPDLLITEIAKIAEQYKPEQFVVGLPRNMDRQCAQRFEFNKHKRQKTKSRCRSGCCRSYPSGLHRFQKKSKYIIILPHNIYQKIYAE